MPYCLIDLCVDRVDFVDEGANSAAFIELYKRKEQGSPMDFTEILSKLKPEHADVVRQTLADAEEQVSKLRDELAEATTKVSDLEGQLSTAQADLQKAKEEAEQHQAEENKDEDSNDMDKRTSFDEAEVLKSMPEGIRNEFLKMRAQKEAAEEQVRKAAEEKVLNEAVAKAATLKALPVDQETLVDILKSCDPRVTDVLTTVAAAIDGTVLTEVGKSVKSPVGGDAWDKIEAEADKIVERDSVTKQRAIATVIKEHPELYKEYLNGGAE